MDLQQLVVVVGRPSSLRFDEFNVLSSSCMLLFAAHALSLLHSSFLH